MRSDKFRVTRTARQVDRLRVTLDKTALVAVFPIVAVEGYRLKLGAQSPFITGHVDETSGNLTDGPNDWFYGCRLGEPRGQTRVVGVSSTSPPWLYVAEESCKPETLARLTGKTVSVWRYGIGDSVEVARIEH